MPDLLASGFAWRGTRSRPVFLFIWLATVNWSASVVLAVLAIVIAIIAAAIGAAWGALHDIRGPLPKNGYGLCSGHAADRAKDGNAPIPLTDWLHQLLQSLAGRTTDAQPVTFGDLWGTKGKHRDLEERKIDLVLMTDECDARRLPSLPVSRRPMGAAVRE
jgi:hypothetical protein